jgi:hypothetical protein
MSFTLHRRAFIRKPLHGQLQQANDSGARRLVKRIQTLLALAKSINVSKVAEWPRRLT